MTQELAALLAELYMTAVAGISPIPLELRDRVIDAYAQATGRDPQEVRGDWNMRAHGLHASHVRGLADANYATLEAKPRSNWVPTR